MDKVYLALFADADFAGDRRDMKSTSGVFLALVGPHTFYPLGFIARKQGSNAQSSTEAELIAACIGVREQGIPALDLWEKTLGRKVQLVLWEDNQSASKIIKTGKITKMRHVLRVEGVS